jgi:hypothetical protein
MVGNWWVSPKNKQINKNPTSFLTRSKLFQKLYLPQTFVVQM